MGGKLVSDANLIRDYTKEGSYSEKMHVGHLKSGLYLLVLSDEEGAKMTKRIVKN
ncbi:MAG: T9SS type A sorting domain-containing protein [Bacteroidetes bacterium]|nr:T9SS type A sorting domain-containing protein [Bacteroidota bacterium]MBT3748070.1 T9SS type A sorting domain-containing protein [Bacteroidota bacterium]MBT4400732.1 T9SS type A sorting domain-containing protein [Bacteroidota bacterium]MBT4408458.1 T9SS type A sorting domain-containing protein [Bacteroidota bacterium]MBT5428100.1 T9SS type A sorting domain-containing protein [Bacteroidota bacterium]